MNALTWGFCTGSDDSTPSNPMKLGQSLYMLIILSVISEIGLPGGPPPVFHRLTLSSTYDFFAVECMLDHFVRTSLTERLATPSEFTAAVMSFHTLCFLALFTVELNLQLIKSMLASTNSVINVISHDSKFFPRIRDIFLADDVNTGIMGNM
jgi:hypothetical protein